MKRRDLEAHLRNHGCQLLRQGANHAIWNNAARDLRAPVPRHREIPSGTARAICRQLGVAAPSGSR
jgi:mRNA interferase HicA